MPRRNAQGGDRRHGCDEFADEYPDNQHRDGDGDGYGDSERVTAVLEP